MPIFKRKLQTNDNQEMIIWSSPAKRALETAEIVADTFQIDLQVVYDFIYGGNYE